MAAGNTCALHEHHYLFCYITASLAAPNQTSIASVKQEQELMLSQCTYPSNRLARYLNYLPTARPPATLHSKVDTK